LDFHLRKALLELILKLFPQPGCADFAHLDAFIKHKNLHGFANGKSAHFKRAEDLVLMVHLSNIVAWIESRFPQPNPIASPTQKRNYTAKEMVKLGKDRVQNLVIKPMYDELFNHSLRAVRNPKTHADGTGAAMTLRDQVGQLITAVWPICRAARNGKVWEGGEVNTSIRVVITVVCWYVSDVLHSGASLDDIVEKEHYAGNI
jgi:hypothetical protein